MTSEQRAKENAEKDFIYAESIADKRGLIAAERWTFICGYLEEKLAIAYEQIKTGETA